MEQYPFTLWVQSVSGGERTDEGVPVQGNITYTQVSKCREETRSANRQVYIGGQAHNFTSFILCPLGCPKIEEGTTVQMRDGNTVLLEKDVIMFREKQLHCRIWV